MNVDTTLTSNMSKLNCPMYNKGLYIEKSDRTSAFVSMCCVQTLSNDTYSVVDFYNNDYLKSSRDSLDTPSVCGKCVTLEKNNLRSFRHDQIAMFDVKGIEITDDTELVSLTYNCENTCNLKCITCGPRFSSLWKSEYSKLGYPLQNISLETKKSGHGNDIYKSLSFDKIRNIYFQGGEPLLTDDHEQILSYITTEYKNLGDVTVSYNTNGTMFPNDNVISLWESAELTKLYFSLDGVGDRFEYIRYPADWKQVEENILRIRNLGMANLWIELGVTVSVANLFYIQDIIDWRDTVMPTLITGDSVNIYINFADPFSYGGDVLSLKHIDAKIKESAVAYVSTITDEPIKNYLLEYLKNTGDGDPSKFTEYLDNLDGLRKTNWKETLSKLYAAIN